MQKTNLCITVEGFIVFVRLSITLSRSLTKAEQNAGESRGLLDQPVLQVTIN